MQKPNKNRQKKQTHSFFSDLFYQTIGQDLDIYKMTQEDIKNILETMELNKIDYLELDLELDGGHSDISIYAISMETEKEAKTRYNKELKKYKASQADMDARERDMLIQKCKEIGLKVLE